MDIFYRIYFFYEKILICFLSLFVVWYKQSFMIENLKKGGNFMKSNKSKSIMILALTTLLASCGGGNANKTFTIDSSAKYGMANRLARREYRTLIATSINNLNYLETQESQDADHFANFIDGLLIHDEFGVLRKNLATEVTHNENFTEFSFKIRSGVKWVNYLGNQYSTTINGKNVKQFVSAEDWITTAKAILNSANASSLKYLIANFVVGAEEYYQYTVIQNGIANGVSKYSKMDGRPDRQAVEINNQIKAQSPNLWDKHYEANPVTADDIENIASLSRLGIKATGVTSEGGGTITYKTYDQASWFPTMFTYSSYMPTNSYFLAEKGFSTFGTSKENLLYCGPYLLTKVDENNVEYVRNKSYWNPSIVHMDKITFQVLPANTGNTYARDQFEKDLIDGFGISTSDQEAWKKYITGPDDSGDMYNPYDPRVNAKMSDTIGSMYGSNIVLDRDKNNCLTSYSTSGNSTTVRNTARALAIKEVRQAIFASLDYPTYNERYGSSTDEIQNEILQNQYMVHTYVPKGFVIDDNGDDYVTSHLYEVYSEKTGKPVGDLDNPEEGTVAAQLKPGQYASRQKTKDQVQVYVEKAKSAIEQYNAQAAEGEKITYPINIEYYSMWFDEETKSYDQPTILEMNKRLNNVDKAQTKYEFFNVVPTDKINQSNYQEVSRNGCWDYAPVQWGWGADYGDPLSFMNTYVKGGDWGDVFPFVKNVDQPVVNYYLDDSGKLVKDDDLLDDYTNLVNEGAAITDDTNARFDKFAEAEYMLLEELCFYQPQVNYGQGWSVSISRAAGYENPQASYGISSARYTGMYVLENVLTRQERIDIRAAQDTAKQAELQRLRDEGKGAIDIY